MVWERWGSQLNDMQPKWVLMVAMQLMLNFIIDSSFPLEFSALSSPVAPFFSVCPFLIHMQECQ